MTTAADNLEAAADNTANAAEAAALENQADALKDEGDDKEEADRRGRRQRRSRQRNVIIFPLPSGWNERAGALRGRRPFFVRANPATAADMTDDAIPAATLVVWRDADPGSGGQPQILSSNGPAGMAFAAGAIVFPGRQDRRRRSRPGRPARQSRRRRQDHRHPRDDRGNAPSRQGCRGDRRPFRGRELQLALNSGADFAELLAGQRLSLDLDSLTPFARWMPGFKHARRFDTFFYLVRAPEGDWPPIRNPANASRRNGPVRPNCSPASSAAKPAPFSRPSATWNGSPSIADLTQALADAHPIRWKLSSPGSRKSAATPMSGSRTAAAIP